MRVWQRLGIALGLSEHDTDEIDIDERGVREKAFNLLIRWKQKFGSDATYEALAEGLSNVAVNRNDLVQEYCCE